MTEFNLSKLEQYILGSCVEDDIGVWELFWEINSKLKSSKDKKFKLGLKIFKKFIVQELIDVVEHENENLKQKGYDYTDLLVILTKNKNLIFKEGSHLKHLFRIRATKKGNNVYFKEKTESL